jgi:hypothetical protein
VGTAQPLEIRLEAFFANWRATSTINPVPSLFDRLARFFEQSHSLASLRAIPDLGAPEIPKRDLDVEQLARTLDCLSVPLAQARSAGAFLNVWAVAGLKRDEVRNAAVLAALFNPNAYPETGPDFLWAFLERARDSRGGWLPDEAELRAGYTVRTEDYPLGQTESRVDLSIEGRTFLLIIEVKIDAGEGHEQLRRYDYVLREKASRLGKRPVLVYLSPRRCKIPPSEMVHATWADVVFAARRVGRASKSSDQSLISYLLLHFASHAQAFT